MDMKISGCMVEIDAMRKKVVCISIYYFAALNLALMGS
jgi:hypothetical protein